MKLDEILNLISETIDKEIIEYMDSLIEYNIVGKEMNSFLDKKIQEIFNKTGRKPNKSFILGYIQGMSQARDISRIVFTKRCYYENQS